MDLFVLAVSDMQIIGVLMGVVNVLLGTLVTLAWTTINRRMDTLEKVAHKRIDKNEARVEVLEKGAYESTTERARCQTTVMAQIAKNRDAIEELGG